MCAQGRGNCGLRLSLGLYLRGRSTCILRELPNRGLDGPMCASCRSRVQRDPWGFPMPRFILGGRDAGLWV